MAERLYKTQFICIMRMFDRYAVIIDRKIGMGMIDDPVVDDMGMVKKGNAGIIPDEGG